MWSFGRSKAEPADDNEIAEALDAMTREMSQAEMQQVAEGFLEKALGYAKNVPFVRELVAGYFCMTDPATPLQAKAALLVPIVYFVLPVDAVPDFIPALGFTDDLAAWTLAFKALSGHVTDGHFASADAVLGREA